MGNSINLALLESCPQEVCTGCPHEATDCHNKLSKEEICCLDGQEEVISILESITHPSQVADFTLDELKKLADEIRSRLIESVSKTGGHLAPSLGVVDLTVAMLSIFNPSEDKIVWDVGHQAYAYKMLTGRLNRFHTLRQQGGISGFPSMDESPFDHFGVGHSTTSISAALGLAVARDLAGEKHHVVSVIGDGSLTGGMAYEAMNHAGSKDRPFIVILNDNEMSITKNVGALSLFMSRNLSKRWIRRVKREVEGFLKNVPGIGEELHEIAKRSKDSFKNFFTPGILFEALRFNYIGAVDGHDIEELQNVLRLAASQDKPVLVHVLTQKGFGYKPAIDNPVQFHGIGRFTPETGRSILSTDQRPSYTDIFGDTIVNLAQKDDRVVAITAAMTNGTGLKNFSELFPDRFFDVGICEQHAVTFAAALATRGLKPFVAIYSTFLQRSYDQIIHDVCLQNLPVTFCIDRAGIVGEDGATHQGAFDLSYLRHIPNMTVMAPANEVELVKALITANNTDAPFAIRYPRGKATGMKMPDYLGPIRVGEAEFIMKNKGGLAVIALGHMVPEAMEAARELNCAKTPISLLNARWIKPLPEKEIKEIFQSYDKILIVEEHALAGGFSSAVLEFCADNGLLQGQKIKRHGLPDAFIKHGKASELRNDLHLNKEGLKNMMESFF